MWAVELSYLELHVVAHCNLVCRACAHASPLQEASFAAPEDIEKDLRKLAPLLHAQRFCLTGGEPLLHPRIGEILTIARNSGIGDRVELLTNGALLARMGGDFWSRVDLVRVSLYPGVSVKLDHPEKTAVTRFDEFRETMAQSRNEDVQLLRRIWDTCGEAGRCSGIMEGRLVPCMRAAYLARLRNEKTGVAIADLTEESIVSFYEGVPFTPPCLYCTGSLGKWFPHQRMTREEFLRNYTRPIEEMLRDDAGRSSPDTPGSVTPV